jgi:hypothetical protein
MATGQKRSQYGIEGAGLSTHPLTGGNTKTNQTDLSTAHVYR